MAGIGAAFKGVGKAYTKFKTRHGPKPGPENKFKYQGRDPTKESKFDWIDRMDAKEAWEAGEKPPFPIGKTVKRMLQGTAAGVTGLLVHGKVKKKLKEKKAEADKRKRGVWGVKRKSIKKEEQ
jgi:hypothetical protein